MAQGFAAPHDSRLHCTQGNLQDFSNFFVAQVRNIAQNDGGPESRVDTGQSVLNHYLFFLIEDIVEGRLSSVGKNVDLTSGIFLLILHADLAVAMAEEPAALVVGLVDGDAEDPGFQGALASKMSDIAEDLEKHLLSDVGCVRWIVQQAQRQVVNRLLKPKEKSFVSLFGT